VQVARARIRGRKKARCSSVPYRRIVGPTVLVVRNGIGQPAAWDSSKKMCCSIGVNPFPPYSTGHPTPSQPSSPTRRISALYSGLSEKSALATRPARSPAMRSAK